MCVVSLVLLRNCSHVVLLVACSRSRVVSWLPAFEQTNGMHGSRGATVPVRARQQHVRDSVRRFGALSQPANTATALAGCLP